MKVTERSVTFFFTRTHAINRVPTDTTGPGAANLRDAGRSSLRVKPRRTSLLTFESGCRGYVSSSFVGSADFSVSADISCGRWGCLENSVSLQNETSSKSIISEVLIDTFDINRFVKSDTSFDIWLGERKVQVHEDKYYKYIISYGFGDC